MNYNLGALTESELNVLLELLKGKTNEEIGETFNITYHTVKAHIKKILLKTNSRHRCELISCVMANLARVDVHSPETKTILRRIYVEKNKSAPF